jgi:hypothetical protein
LTATISLYLTVGLELAAHVRCSVHAVHAFSRVDFERAAVTVDRVGPGTARWQAPRWLVPSVTAQEWLAALFFLGLGPRLILLAAQPDRLEFWEYETLAQNLVSGQGYVIPRFGHLALSFGDGNLYSFLSASVYLVAGHQPLVLAVVQALLASLAAPVIFAVGAPALGGRVAGAGATLAALHPGLLAYTLKLHPLGIDVLLMALMLLWIGRVGGGKRDALMAGLALGMSLMTRPTFFVAGVSALAVRWRGGRYRLVASLSVVAVAVVIATPWVARNWALHGRPMFISSSFEDIWKGNNPGASGSGLLPNKQDIFSAAPAELQARFHAATELELNDIFMQEVVGFVTGQPGDFGALVARKFAYFWWISPQTGLLYPSAWLAMYQIYAAIVLSFAFIGAVVILRQGNAAERDLLAVLAAVTLTVAVIHALAYVEGRHRWGIEPLLLLLTARGLFATAESVRRRRSTPG